MPAPLAGTWQRLLGAELDAPYMRKLREFLQVQKRHGQEILPPSGAVFKAFAYTPFEAVKVVILGQDPYHGVTRQGVAQANGLSFSVPEGVALPPSLQNIYKHLHHDLQLASAPTGDLSPWARQGVLLLNSVLTVNRGAAGSHQNQGWEQFTDCAIRALNEHRQHVVFMLWGKQAQQKTALIDADKHLILTAPHPSPLSAHRGFLTARHFSAANQYLSAHQIQPIDWALQ